MLSEKPLRVSGVEEMTWSDAEQGGYLRFARYSRFLCGPAGPRSGGDVMRQQILADRLAGQIQRGALAIFLVPPAEGESDYAWHESLSVVERVTGVVLEPVPKTLKLKPHFESTCPDALRSFIGDEPIHYSPGRLRAWAPKIYAAPVRVDSSGGDAHVIGGLPGSGAWLLLPCARRWLTAGDVSQLLDVTCALQTWREAQEPEPEASAQPNGPRVSAGVTDEQRHGECFEWILIGATRYDFTRKRQREVIRVLWEAEGKPICEDEILRKIDPVRAERGDVLRLRDVFKTKNGMMHEAWDTAILSCGKRTRTYRLAR